MNNQPPSPRHGEGIYTPLWLAMMGLLWAHHGLGPIVVVAAELSFFMDVCRTSGEQVMMSLLKYVVLQERVSGWEWADMIALYCKNAAEAHASLQRRIASLRVFIAAVSTSMLLLASVTAVKQIVIARKIYYWDLTSGIRACGELLKKRIYRSDLKPFLKNFNKTPSLISLSTMSNHEDETITAENTSPKNIPQITTVTNISAKFPYLKKGEYDIWAMTIQNFISSSGLLCWNIVLKGNSAKSMTTDNDGNLKIHPPITAEEHQQNAIKARFGGNVESKKMQKSLLKQKFKEFKISKEEGLDKGYDKMQKILSQMNTLKIKPKPEDVNMKFLRGLPPSWSDIALILKTKGGLKYISFDDLYNKLKFLEIDTKGYSSSSSTLSNAVFGSSKSKCSVVDDVVYSFFANHEIDQQLIYVDLDQMNKDEFEEYDLKHQMAMLSNKVHRFEKKRGWKIKFNGRENARFDKKLMKCFNCKQIGHFSREYQTQGVQNSNNYQKYKSKEAGKDGSNSKAMVVVDGSIDWYKQTEEGNTDPRSLENFGMLAGIKLESDVDSEGEVVSADDVIPTVVSVSAGPVATAAVVYSLRPNLHSWVFLLSLEKQIKCHQTNQLAYEEKIRVLSYELEEKSNILEYRQKLIDQATQEKHDLMTKLDNELANQAKWNNSGKNLYKLIDSSMSVRTKRGLGLDKYIGEGELGIDDFVFSIFHTTSDDLEGDRSSKPSTNDFQTCDSNQECSRPNRSDHDSNDSISSVSAPVSASSDTIVIDCARQEDFPSVCPSSIKTDVKSSKTLCNKFSYLHLIKYCDFHEQTFAKRNAEGKGKLGKRPTGKPVNPNRPYPVSTGSPNPVYAGQPNPVSAGWSWTKSSISTTKGSKINGESKSKSWSFAKGPLGRPKMEKAKDRGIVDSGCSRSMSGNKDKLEDFEHFDGGEVTFGGSTGKLSGKGTIKTKTLNIENVLYVKELQHFNLISVSEICDQTHRVLFTKNECLVLSKDFPLPDPSIVILSIPRKHNLYTFSLNELAPQGPLTCLVAKASQTESTLWHRRLGQVNFQNINKLVKGNLVREAARTMLADSFLPTIFWTEAVATACYVLNRVLVTKPHAKTPYELLTGDKPSISYLKPFGCHMTILNTSESLGKFDKKSDEGSQSRNPSNIGSQEDDADSDDEPDVLIIHSTPTPVIPIIDETTILHDGIKSDHATTNVDNLDEFTKLQSLQRQEQARKKEADRLGLAFLSLNPILGVGSASIGSSISAGSTPPVSAGGTPPLSPCASPISADRHFISVGQSLVPAARPPVSAGRSTSAGRPIDFAGRPVSAGRPSGFAARTSVSAGRILRKSGIFTSSSYDKDLSGPDANNLENSFDVSSLITKRIHTIHPTSQVIGDINSPVQTRSQAKMQQFKNQQVWVLVTLPEGKRAVGTKWILKNKRDARGIVCRNKVGLVAQGHRQEEGIDYTDVFAPVARLEAIRLFLAFASFIGFKLYQMDVKSAFLYGKITEEVYVTQPRGFEDPDHPKKVYKVVKALYGLHQAPRAWYERLSTFLLKHGYRRETIDRTLFIKKEF
nr:putative ribonuclease H-like domain-containing protein [Tanacetum cinerariifolium]